MFDYINLRLGTTSCIPALCLQKTQPGSSSWVHGLIKNSAWWTSRSSSLFPFHNGAQPCAGSPHQHLSFPKCSFKEPTCPWTQWGRLEDAAIPVPFLPSAHCLPFQPHFPAEKISREELELHSSYLLYYLNVKLIFLLHSLQKIDSMVALTALSYRNNFHLSERFCSISYNNVVLNLHLRKKKMVLGKNPAAKIENSKMFYDNSLKWNCFSIKNPLKVKWNLPAQRQISRDSITETACNPLI